MRICLIGTGSIAQEHVENFKQIGGVDFDTVISRLQENAEEFAHKYSFVKTAPDLESAIANGLFDTVIICSPSNLHAVQAEQALMADKHVLVEIPIATNYTDAQRIARLSDKTDKTLMVGHIQRFFQPLMEVKRRIDAGDFNLHHFVGSWFFLRRQNINWRGRKRSWTDNLLWHHSCHVIDTALWLLNEHNLNVSGVMSKLSETLNIPLDLGISLRTQDGKMATIVMSYNSNWSIHQYTLIGQEETIIYEDQKIKNQDEILYETSIEPLYLMDEEFVNAVRQGRISSVNAWTVLPTMRILQQIQNQNPHVLPASEII